MKNVTATGLTRTTPNQLIRKRTLNHLASQFG